MEKWSLINVRDVVMLYLPFPGLQASLAKKAHMYICLNKTEDVKQFLKVQTPKPQLFCLLKNFIIELPDIQRNPFINPSLIDLDKIFSLYHTFIPLSLRTKRRKDIANHFYFEILDKLSLKQTASYLINDRELLVCNEKLRLYNLSSH
ncbi:hypothetical protein OF377_00845 [Ureaplasma sp. ES3154-GEN]|uniref:hypothetical protein n=1 Tax=Ureaplasma sp. ES3154-GEN TaxID=2984844 RepID=UPI0021E8FF27|nr:hypothetical protein [Ureaplasma sp. ES3154-GEN]MCV3743435.1 hypothetical protein [Ureaplasma sp. ES3154-GEN]